MKQNLKPIISSVLYFFCPIRKEQVAALPEERVRQRILRHMFEERGFPASLVSVEKSLKQMPHLSPSELALIPNRRADIVCFAKGIHTSSDLYPLLIVECKAIKLNSRVIHQVLGYNRFVRACFIAIANDNEMRLGWYDKKSGEYSFVDHLPSYSDLVHSVALLH